MKLQFGWCVLAAVPCALLAVACGGDRAEDEMSVAEHRIDSFETIITTESAIIGLVSALDVSGDGRVWMSDRMNHRIVYVDPEEGQARVIGREGAGPGEMLRPEGVAVSDSTVIVFDFGNRRFQVFDLEGDYLSSRSISVQPFLPLYINSQGDLALPTLGGDESLVAVYREQDAPVLVGDALAPQPTMISAAAIGEQVAGGEMPLEFQNNVLPVLGEGGELWVVIQSTGVMNRYGADGELVWSKELREPEVQLARERFFEEWASDDRQGFPVPLTVVDGSALGGSVFLMMGAAEEGESVVLEVDRETGDVVSRISLSLGSSAGPFAIDSERGFLYTVLPDEATLLRVTLP